MKKQILCVFFIIAGNIIFVYSQEQKTIYETGRPLTSCECNFENLFANWGPRYVTNYDSLKLVSYHYVETLEDTARIAFYARKFSDRKGVFARTEGKGAFHPDIQKTVSEFRIYPYFFKPRPDIPKEVALAEIRELQQHLRAFLHIGDKVFAVKFKYDGTEYVVDVFCRPGVNRIILDKMFSGMVDLCPDR